MSYPGRDRVALIVSILSVGTFVGALSAGYVSDKLGRKYGIIISAMIPFNLGVALQTAATEQIMFIMGRLFAGFGVGLISAQIPMYQSETLPKWIRGTIVGCYQLCITIGLFLAAIVSYCTKDRDDSGSYRIPLAIQFAWALILSGGLAFLPETPRYLIKVGKDAKALKSLVFLRRLPADSPHVLAELEEIKANYEYEKSLGTASYVECFRGNMGKRTLTGIVLQSLQQLVGINFIVSHLHFELHQITTDQPSRSTTARLTLRRTSNSFPTPSFFRSSSTWSTSSRLSLVFGQLIASVAAQSCSSVLSVWERASTSSRSPVSQPTPHRTTLPHLRNSFSCACTSRSSPQVSAQQRGSSPENCSP